MKYTVLLLRPDYVADTFGQDTFCAHVEGDTAEAALAAARAEACEADGQDDPEDYYCLFCTDGHVADHTPPNDKPEIWRSIIKEPKLES
jgi:hypothetical protein